MMRRTIRRHITAPPEAVMEQLLDISRWPQWRPGLVGVAHVSDQRLMLATAWNEDRRFANRSLTLLARAVEIDPPQTFAYTARGDSFEVQFRWTTRPDDGSTLVRQDTAVRATGLRNWLSGAAKQFLAEQDAGLDRFRHLMLPSTQPTSRM